MRFNSLDFAVFLPLVFILYWLIPRKKITLQNILLLIASYVFYGWWDYRFLSLIIFSSTVDYFVGIQLDKTLNKAKRKLLLALSLVANLGLLGVFKYYNFFVSSFIDMFREFGVELQYESLKIILPVGISFYTFQTLSYTLDIYKGKLSSTKDALAFFAFVSFFPQLVAGPIERASNLLPQFTRQRNFDIESAKDGMRQILWGLFKKIVIADNCAKTANYVFGNYQDIQGPVLFLGAIFFAFQIYCDFSAYSDIAIGTARLFGFSLMRNFAYPYFSRDIAEFWRRWHISLSTWFRDYLYFPLGGSRVNNWLKIRNVMIVFVVSGLWHGANWTFVVWGALNALYFLPLILTKSNRKYLDTPAEGKLIPSIREFYNILFTFILTCFAWIFFRSNTLTDAFGFIHNMFFFKSMSFSLIYFKYFPFVVGLLIIEWIQRDKQYALEIHSKPIYFRWISYFTVLLIIFFFGVSISSDFIYFQF
ncbi:MAG: MBOAT family protein [Bacteroidales bacterium]|nr:MBOAT family protein [Bacteroidales bacterium]